MTPATDKLLPNIIRRDLKILGRPIFIPMIILAAGGLLESRLYKALPLDIVLKIGLLFKFSLMAYSIVLMGQCKKLSTIKDIEKENYEMLKYLPVRAFINLIVYEIFLYYPLIGSKGHLSHIKNVFLCQAHLTI